MGSAIAQSDSSSTHTVKFNVRPAAQLIFQGGNESSQVVNVKANTGWALMETLGESSKVVAEGAKTGDQGVVLNLKPESGSDLTLVVP